MVLGQLVGTCPDSAYLRQVATGHWQKPSTRNNDWETAGAGSCFFVGARWAGIWKASHGRKPCLVRSGNDRCCRLHAYPFAALLAYYNGVIVIRWEHCAKQDGPEIQPASANKRLPVVQFYRTPFPGLHKQNQVLHTG
jgi:hypothetical protein